MYLKLFNSAKKPFTTEEAGKTFLSILDILRETKDDLPRGYNLCNVTINIK